MRPTSERTGPSWRTAGYVLAVACTAAVPTALLVQAVVGYQLDLSVYRDAGAAFLHGSPLYSADFPTTSGFRFIYPPFAAVLFGPMALVSPQVLQVSWVVLNIALVWWILRTCLNRLDVNRPGRLALVVLGPALLLEPVRANFGFGQINIVLMALVIAGCLCAVPSWIRGACLGMGAAIKLTPAGFALVLLARRDTKATITAAAVLMATIVAGAWLLPRDSIWFWATEFFRDERAGKHEFSRNQAITGPLARLGVDGLLRDAVWLGAAIVVALVAFWAARRFARSGEHLVCVGVVALALLLAAPIAVNHHWVYCILLVPLLIADTYRRWRPTLAIAFVAFLVGPHFLLEKTASSPPWQAALLHLVGNAQFLAAVALFIGAAVAARNRDGVAVDHAEGPQSLDVAVGGALVKR